MNKEFRIIGKTFQYNLFLSSYVTEVFCSYMNGEIKIHVRCNEGDEDKLIKTLPMWIEEEMTITKTHMGVFLAAKK